jgi:hypothetical protein
MKHHAQHEASFIGTYWDKSHRRIVVTRNGYGQYRQSVDGSAPADICPAALERLVETGEYTRMMSEKSANIKFGEGFTGDVKELFYEVGE